MLYGMSAYLCTAWAMDWDNVDLPLCIDPMSPILHTSISAEKLMTSLMVARNDCDLIKGTPFHVEVTGMPLLPDGKLTFFVVRVITTTCHFPYHLMRNLSD